jgi:NAD(P)-dependent dehydrogenase (short-subunit alcohol dehydrogenase family)
MSISIGSWNQGRTALVIGSGAAVEAVAEGLRQSGAHVHRCDHGGLQSETVAASRFDEAEAALGGGVDILVYADAQQVGAAAEQFSLDEWHGLTQLNLDGRFFCCQQLARRCLAGGRPGVMLHLMSKAAERAQQGLSAAASAAGGVLNLNMSLAVEWARDNLRSNVIATRLVDECGEKDGDALASLAALAAYYCSDYGAYITGSCVGIDEG